ncbi:hypothetical protein [Herbaspirillum sp. alder98]|uniref:hypothetical protein n=1 Tax=Herbaspirillum sp. alder98 TaxID=2913096 RepID=UPI001CD89614|nr:hypothetical protein [Herbaspirillum sp. alder98]MCA1323058.1 hypothetical protein [Herbaspirillum sp. alder98]
MRIIDLNPNAFRHSAHLIDTEDVMRFSLMIAGLFLSLNAQAAFAGVIGDVARGVWDGYVFLITNWI